MKPIEPNPVEMKLPDANPMKPIEPNPVPTNPVKPQETNEDEMKLNM